MERPRCSGAALLVVLLNAFASFVLSRAERLDAGQSIDWRTLAAVGALGGASPRFRVSALYPQNDIMARLDREVFDKKYMKRLDNEVFGKSMKKRRRYISRKSLLTDRSDLVPQRLDTGLSDVLAIPPGGLIWGKRPWTEEQETVEVQKEKPVKGLALESVYSELQDSLEEKKFSLGEKLARRLCESLQAQRLKLIKDAATGETGVEYYSLFDADGTRQAVLMRFLTDEARGESETRALQNMLSSMQDANPEGFLEVFAQSRTPSDLDGGDAAGVMLLVEPFEMTLRQYLEQGGISFRATLRAWFQVVCFSLRQLYRKGFAHTSEISLDNVLITADMEGEAHSFIRSAAGRAVLSPSVLRTDLQVCSLQKRLEELLLSKGVPPGMLREEEMLQSDIRACGRLLDEMLLFPQPEKHLDLTAFRAMAKSMRSGVYDNVASEWFVTRKLASMRFWDHVYELLFLEFPVRRAYEPMELSSVLLSERLVDSPEDSSELA